MSSWARDDKTSRQVKHQSQFPKNKLYIFGKGRKIYTLRRANTLLLLYPLSTTQWRKKGHCLFTSCCLCLCWLCIILLLEAPSYRAKVRKQTRSRVAYRGVGCLIFSKKTAAPFPFSKKTAAPFPFSRKAAVHKAAMTPHLINGSLDDWLHSKKRWLSLDERVAVAIDVGLAMEYLHEQGETPIVLCDLKPSNVLLDDDMNAHVGDFRLARFLSEGITVPIQGFSDSAAVKGSIGYVAPEYGMGNRLSTRGDVYSYGILLLEILTRRGPTDPMLEEGMVLRQFVEAAFLERVMEIVDQTLLPWENGGDIDSVLDGSSRRVRLEQCLISILRILLCSKEAANERMEMRDVVVEMQAIRATYLKGLPETWDEMKR